MRIVLWLLFCIASQFLNSNVTAQDRWLKGNLHTHSFWSDGNHFPEAITKWYSERDYHFLALTDHNVLSNSERWMPLKQAQKRGGTDILEKYLAEFGEDWVETRADKAGEQEIRLKKLDEYRSRFEQPEKFLLLTGEEISDKYGKLPIHMNAINLAQRLQPAGGQSVSDTMQNNYRATIEQAKKIGQPILIFLNHPNFGWAVTGEDLAAVTEQKFFEVYNGHPAINQLGDEKRASVEKIWDIANTLRITKLNSAPMMGLGTDDSHQYHGRGEASPGRGWIMVRADELTPAALLTAINAGEFYASSGVTLEQVEFDADAKTLSVAMPSVEGINYTTQFIGTPKKYHQQKQTGDENGDGATKIYSPDIGKVFKEVIGDQASYELTGNELYVRAVITSSADHPNPSFTNQKQQAWTQPVGWKKHLK